MRLLLVIVVMLGVLFAFQTAVHAYPIYQGRVVDSTHAFTDGQITGLNAALLAQDHELKIQGHILCLDTLDTWQIEPYADRLLTEWRAQGVVEEESWLLLMIPSQHRLALALSPKLAKRLDPWTREQLTARCALHCEEGTLYIAASTVIDNFNTMPALSPKRGFLQGVSQWPWMLIGFLLITFALYRRAKMLKNRSAILEE